MQKGPYFNNVQYISPVPEGYLQASSQIANNYASAIRGLGENIGAGIEKYYKNKAEGEMLDQQLQRIAPAIQQYAQQATKAGNTEAAEKWTKLASDVSKFHDVGLNKKRALISGAMTEVSLFEKGQEMSNRAMQMDAAREQLLAAQYQNELFRRNRKNEEALSFAIGDNDPNMGQPAEDTQSNVNTPTAEEVQAVGTETAPPPPTEIPQEIAPAPDPGVSIPTQLTAGMPPARQPNPYIQFGAEQNMSVPGLIYSGFAGLGNATDFALRAAQAGLTGITTGDYRIPKESLPRSLGNALGDALAPRVDYPVSTRTPPPAAVPAQVAAPVAAPATAEAPAPAAKPTAPAAVPVAAPAPSGERADGNRLKELKVTLTKRDQYAAAVSRYLSKGGILTLEIDKQLRDKFGITPEVDIRTHTLKDENGKPFAVGVVANGELKVVPLTGEGLTPKERLENQKDTDARTVTLNGQQFFAPTASEGVAMRAAVASNQVVKQTVSELIGLADSPDVKIPGTKDYNRAVSIQKQLRGLLRVELTGPGAVNASEYQLMDDIIADPTAIFSLKGSTKTKLNELLATTDRKLASHAKSLNFYPMSQNAPGGSNSGGAPRYVRDPKTGKISPQ